MKFLITLFIGTLIVVSGNCQFQEIVVVEIDNKGIVPGKTYQFYAKFKNEGDHVHLVFGDDVEEMLVKTSTSFYQNEFGGSMSSNINPKLDSLDQTVKYDSYVSIGRTNSYENYMSNFNLDLTEFEEKGSDIRTENGAWFVTPDQEQAYCRGGNKYILIMQLTTDGEISGQVSMQGKDNDGIIWRELAVPLNTNGALDEKTFRKIQKKDLKTFKKTGL